MNLKCILFLIKMFSCVSFNKEYIIKKLRVEKSKSILKNLQKANVFVPETFFNDLNKWVSEYKYSSGKIHINDESHFLIYQFDDLYHTSVKIISR